MNFLTTNFASSSIKLLGNSEGLAGVLFNIGSKRCASKKTSGSSKNHSGVPHPKRRGVKYNDGRFVQEGTLLATQNTLRFHPGLNVGMGKNGTLYALLPGRVVVSTEKIQPNMEHTWNQRQYGGRELDRIYKKYFHVLPETQHCIFKRIN